MAAFSLSQGLGVRQQKLRHHFLPDHLVRPKQPATPRRKPKKDWGISTYLGAIHLGDSSNGIATTARLEEMDEDLHWHELPIAAHCKEDAKVLHAAAIKGLKPLP